jgi:Repeat of unknown function (DUF5648)
MISTIREYLKTLIHSAAMTMALALFCATAARAQTVPVVEFLNTNTGNYFITADSNEIAVLSDLEQYGWVRTEYSFEAWPLAAIAPDNAVGVCRFYSATAKSHFHTADANECAVVKNATPYWQYEGIAFYVTPAVSGKCETGTAIMRSFNNRAAEGLINHRFTVEPQITDNMMASGWQDEGIAMCAASDSASAYISAAGATNVTSTGSLSITAPADFPKLIVVATPALLESGKTSVLSTRILDIPGIGRPIFAYKITKWEILSGGGTLSATSGDPVTYTAPTVDKPVRVMIRATPDGTNYKPFTAELLVLPKPTSTVAITSVRIVAPQGKVLSGKSTPLLATVIGTGNYNRNVTWSIVAGGGVIRIVTTAAGSQAVYDAPTVTKDTEVTLKAVAVGDTSKSATVKITVYLPPPPPPITVTGVKVEALFKPATVNQANPLFAVVIGTGNYDRDVIWKITTGAGKLSNTTGPVTNYTPAEADRGKTVTVTATAKANAAISGSVILAVKP